MSRPHLVGGCYTVTDNLASYLPKVEAAIHTIVLDSLSRTTLTQTFVNPSDHVASQVKYVFPLAAGVSVVGFSCAVGSRLIKGVVKEWREAHADFARATSLGQTAGLFLPSRKASDIFSTTVGNLPPGEEVRVEIIYLAELKHDAEIDGLRLTIPTIIAPRYGAAARETETRDVEERGISITVDVEMPEGCVIRSIQSPSHPMAVSIGSLSTTTSTDTQPSLRKASATFSQQSVGLDIDVVLDITTSTLEEPAAFLETHPTIPNHRALMATLVPKFKTSPSPASPEIVFLCDRSGSMRGQIHDLVAALGIFLRSLPAGVHFNICSFGTAHSFLWEESRLYGPDSFDEAGRHVASLEANMGGTNIHDPLQAAFERRREGTNLEVFVLTDGRINSQDALFSLIHSWTERRDSGIRVFSLGVGFSVSSALVEGMARAGGGFAQTVHASETMDRKVVRMLRAALTPHVRDYSLDVKYGRADADDGFEMVEKVSDSLLVHLDDEWVELESQTTDKEIPGEETTGEANDQTEQRSSHQPSKDGPVPMIAAPDYIQVPSQITQVFPYSRTTAYVLLANQDPAREPKSVILRATGDEGPLELEIPIVHLAGRSSMIHQMAARREIGELEAERGWLSAATGDDGELLAQKLGPGFSRLAKREAVRLGVQFQVAGKWTSFVAVEEPLPDQSRRDLGDNVDTGTEETSMSVEEYDRGSHATRAIVYQRSSNTISEQRLEQGRRGFCAKVGKPSSSRGASMPEATGSQSSGASGSSRGARRAPRATSSPSRASELSRLIALQGFGGVWTWSRELTSILRMKLGSLQTVDFAPGVSRHEQKDAILATLCAVALLEKRFVEQRETWELVAGKAREWLREQIGDETEACLEKVAGLV